MRIQRAAFIAGVALACLAGSAPAQEQERLPPGTTTSAIERWAQREAEPVWRLPLGQAYVDEMQLVERDRLLVALKSISKGVPGRECLLVDLRTGSVIWRLEREKQGTYSPLFTWEGLLLLQIDEPDRHWLLAVDAATGAERWKVRPNGDQVRFYPAPEVATILVERREDRKIELSAFNLRDGRELWNHEVRLEEEQPAPASPLLSGDGFWRFYGGVERVRLEDGTAAWSRPDLALRERDAPPQRAENALFVAPHDQLVVLDAATGATRWSTHLDFAVTNVFPYDSTVYVRGDLPYREPAGRFTIRVPTAYPLVWQQSDVRRFQDERTGAFIMVGYYSSGTAETISGGLLDVLESISDGSPNRRSAVDTTVAGEPARWARYTHKVEVEDGDDFEAVSYIGAVWDGARGGGVGFFGFTPQAKDDDVRKEFRHAFQSVRFGEPQSVAQRWQQRATTGGDGASFQITALRAQDGARRWDFETTEVTVSNFVELGDRVYVASPTTLFGLDAGSGKRLFSTEVTNTGRTFPVRLRGYEDKIAVISELVIAAFDPESGDKIYSHGIMPISQEATLSGLDNSIPIFEEMVATVGQVAPQGGIAGMMSGLASAEAHRYQNMANQYWSRAQTQRSLGEDPSLSYMQHDLASSRAKIEATAAFVYSVLELGTMLWQAFRIRGWQKYYEDILARQQLFRRSILGAYGMAEVGDYVYRPQRRLSTSQEGDFTALTVVHLPSGRRRTTTLSPTYLNYGLWNLVDMDRQLVYHHGLGLAPSLYEYGDKVDIGLQGKRRTVESFLIAAPVRVPDR